MNFHAIEKECARQGEALDPQFALAALMELPAQYKYVRDNNML